MTRDEYRVAIAALGLSQKAAGRWLGVSEKTAHNYATKGPTGPAARAISMALRFGLELTASQSLKLDLLASEAGKPRSTVIAELIEGAATAVVP